MIRNYLKTAWRNITKNKLLSSINFIGLSVGIAAVLLISLYIQNEMSYDRFHLSRKLIYRVGFESFNNGKPDGVSATFTAAFGPDAKRELPEIQSYCRVSVAHEAILANGEQLLKSAGMCYADSTFFTMFSFPLQAGNAANVLQQPYSIVLTAALAQKLFGNSNAVGKIIRLDGNQDYLVTGIATPAPGNSQISYEAVASMSTLYKDTLNYYMGWNGGNQYITYLQLYPNSQPMALQKKFPDFMWRKINSAWAANNSKVNASLQPLTDVHLQYEDDSANTRTNLYVFTIIALLILVVSAVNYINLTTAQASARFKEIGVRKVLGAVRKQLIKQFVGESLMLTCMAFLLSLLVVHAAAPLYARLSDKPLALAGGNSFILIIPALLVVLFIGLGAGSYLALYLSSLNVQQTLKASAAKSKHSVFRKALIIGQFAITIALMTCTLVVNLQLRYIKNKSMGFDKEHIIALPLTGGKAQESALLLKQRIKQLAGVELVSAVSEVPHAGIERNGFVPEGAGSAMFIHQLDADEDLLATFKLKMMTGNYFSKDRPTDASGYIINETLAKTMGWNNPLGKKITRDGEHIVIGVVQDFIFSSLHQQIEPLIITNHPWQNRYSYLAIRYSDVNPAPLLQQINDLWKHQVADTPFEYWFLDDAFNKLYKNEQRFQQMFFYFSVLSIALSLAGIFGLVTLIIRQRTKEIGIRKILGANLLDITKLTTGGFVQLIVLAAVIAIPVSWYYMHNWLQDFAFRITLSWWMFIITGGITLIIALVTISVQTIMSARANPVKSLRTD